MAGIDSEFQQQQNVREETWTVRRYGAVVEVVEWDDSIKYLVIIQDVGRKPFVNRKFNSRKSAENFLDSVMKETKIA